MEERPGAVQLLPVLGEPEKQSQADQADGAERPPKVDAARERELQEAAEDTLFDAADHEENNGPQPGKLVDCGSRERDGPEVEPAARCQRAHQRREKEESGRQAAEEVWNAARAIQVVSQKAAAAFDESHQRSCPNQRQ